MRNITFLILLSAIPALAQFTAGHTIVRNENTGTYYVTSSMGNIYFDTGQGFQYAGVTAGANSGQTVIANDKLYVVRIDDIKVYDLDPVHLDTVWDTPATEWLFGLAWDGDSTLYCCDTHTLIRVDMRTGVSTPIFTDFQGSIPGRMAYDPMEDRLLFLENNVGISGYDLQAGTYSFLLPLPYHRLHDITHACGNQWLLAIEYSQGGGMLYTVPDDLSTTGDTTFWSMAVRPQAVYYDALGDSARFVVFDTVLSAQAPCTPVSGVSEVDALPKPSIFIDYDRLTITWPIGLGGGTLVRLIDPLGRVLWTEKISDALMIQGHAIDLQGISAGTYRLLLQHEGRSVAKAFVLMR